MRDAGPPSTRECAAPLRARSPEMETELGALPAYAFQVLGWGHGRA
jgi:hypothetical protein